MCTRLLLVAAFAAAIAEEVRAEDPKPAQLLRTPDTVTWIAITPDGKHLLTGDRGETRVGNENKFQLRLWSVGTGKLVAGPVSGPGLGASGAVSPDGRMVITGGTAGEWRLWELPALTPTARGTVGNSRIDRVAFRSDGKAFTVLHAQYGPNNSVSYQASTLDTETRKPVGGPIDWPAERPGGSPAGWTLTNNPSFGASGVPIRPEGRAAEPLEVPGDDEKCGGPTAWAISGDGKVAVSAGCNGKVIVWDYPTRKVVGEPLAKWGRLEVMNPGLVLSPDGRLVAVARMAEHGVKGHLLSLTVYDVGTRAVAVGPIDLGALGVGLVSALAISPNGSFVAIAFDRRGDQEPTSEIQLWKVPAKK
jgi:WD40 repeat protein